MTDSKLETFRAQAKKKVINDVCPEDYDDRYLPIRLKKAVDLAFDIFAGALIETDDYDWHERDCAVSDPPPGPFPCDCKISKGWTVFVLPPPLRPEEKSFVGFVKHNGAGELIFKQASYYGKPANESLLNSLINDGWTPVFTGYPDQINE